jgi:amidophosphoribosyltransferase
VYFARPDSRVFGRDVHQTRLVLGRQLAREAPADADVVVPVPDSGTVAAVGYSQGSGLPLEFGLIRNLYVGRTFIEPRQSIRHFGVKVKLNPVRSVIEGRRIVLIDDSIVRGTTSRKIVGMVRLRERRRFISASLRLRPPAPDTTASTPRSARSSSPRPTASLEIARFVGADSLGYLSQEGLLSAVAEDRDRYCSACFSMSRANTFVVYTLIS